MIANTDSMNGAGTDAWNRSDIELTNTSRGCLHRNGSSKRRLVHRDVESTPVLVHTHGLQTQRHARTA